MSTHIDHLLNETRRFAPSAKFAANAVATSELFEQASADRLEFWADQARTLLHWDKPFTQTLDWSNPPLASSTSLTTASTGTSKRATVSASRSIGKARTAIPAR